jgi:hypothetical protein
MFMEIKAFKDAEDIARSGKRSKGWQLPAADAQKLGCPSLPLAV